MYRDNADDFMGSSLAFQEAWLLLETTQCAPSIEVFEHGYIEAAHLQPNLSPVAYAKLLVAKYARRGEIGWWRYSVSRGRLVPT